MNIRYEMTELFLDWAGARFSSLLEWITHPSQAIELAYEVKQRAAWLDLDDPRIDDMLERINEWGASAG